jgi:dTDP-4-dehydrorhamnose reductase
VPSVYPISSGEYPVAAQRPLYSVLSNQKLLAKFNLQLPSWEAALDDVFEQIVVDAAKPARQV